MRTANEDLLDVRLRGARNTADRVRLYRRVAPSKNREAFLTRNSFHHSFHQQPMLRLNRKENHADAVDASRRKCEAELSAFTREKRVRDLNQNTRAVAGLRVASACAAVRQVNQNLDSLENNIVRLFALDVNDKPEATSIVLVGGVVQSLLSRKSVHWGTASG